MPKTLTLRVDDQTYGVFLRKAQSENRSLSNFIETAVKAHIAESAFTDDLEMAEIRSNKRLLERLKQGSKDVTTKKGTMVG